MKIASVSRLTARLFAPLLLLIFASAGPLRAQSSTTVTLTVPGTANPWLAPAGATDAGGDSVPAESPVAVTNLDLTAGNTLTFTATGSVSYAGDTPIDPPDGSLAYFYPHPAENGLSGVNAQVDSLIGVFIDDRVADPTNANAPATLDFNSADTGSVAGGNDYTSLQPALGETFFIGDGVTSSGTSQPVTVPAGATHLYLGTMDGSGWYNNTGSFQVSITGLPVTSTALTATAFQVDGSVNPSTVMPGAAITFSATQGAAASSGVYVRVQTTATPTVESSWTDLTDTTNGGAGFLKGDGYGDYNLITTQYPLGAAIYLRVISAATGQTDSISNIVGPFNLTAASPNLTATTLLVNGSAQPSIVAAGAALTFTATQGAEASSGVFVRAQATATPTDESSWTDLTDTTNGGAGFLKGDGNGNYTLTTTQYPLGAAIYFRVISAASGQPDSICNIVGPFNLTAAGNPTLTATAFLINGSSQAFAVTPGAPLTFTATQGAAAGSGVFVRVQATATPNVESSWTDLTDTTNGGAGFLKGDGNGNYALTTTQYPSGPAVSFRVISASSGQTDSISNIIGSFNLTNASTPILTIDQTASTPDDPQANVAIIGDLITYTFTIRNTGTAPATNVSMVDVLPTTLNFQSTDAYPYVYLYGNTFKCPFQQIAPGTAVTFKVITAVTSATPLGSVVNNRGYNVQATGIAAIQGTDINRTTIIPPLEVTVSGNGSKLVPGQMLTYTIAVTNRSPGQIKGIKLAAPLPAAGKYVSAGFFNAAGKPVTAPPSPSGGANPELNGGGTLFFYIDALASKSSMYLHLVVQIPVDADPVQGVILPGAKVTTATKIGGVTSFTLPDIDTPLSGQGPAAKPQLTFSKLPIDAIDLAQSIGAQPAEATKLLAAIKAAAKANPALIAEFVKIYPGLAALKSLSAPVADFAAALDPDVSYDDAETGSGQLTNITVNSPSAASPTYIAFVLPYANSGKDTLSNVLIQDRVPTGTSIYAAGTTTYNGSVIINGQLGNPATGGNLEIADHGRSLTFHLGNIAPGAEGFVIYKVRVLAPGEAGAPSAGAVLATSGSVLSSTSLSHTYIGQPDGRDITVVGPYDYYLESNQVSSNTALLSQPVVYEIYYQNTGSRKSAILDIDDPIPTGLQYVTTELFDANHNKLLKAPASAVDVPGDPTKGTLVFHTAKFTSSGTVAPGAGGYIRIYFAPLTVTNNGFVHSPFIPKSSFATKGSNQSGSRPQARTQYGPVTRGTAAATTPEHAASMTRVDETGLAKLFIAVAMPMTMVEGAPSEIFLVGGSLNDTAINDVAAGTLTMILPKGVQYEPLNEFGTDYASYQTSQTSAGLTELQINFVNGLPAHGAAIAKFVVQPQVGTASKAAVVFPGCTLTLGPSTPFSLQTGPINVRVMTTSEAASLSTLQGQVAGVVLNTSNPSDPLLKSFISHITAASRNIVIAAASGVSSNNGSVVVPLQGGNVLAMGPAGTVGAQGKAKATQTSHFDFICATGAGTDITIEPAAGIQGATLPAQSAETLLGNVTSTAAGNGVKIGALSLLNGGGSNLISQDGNGLISQDGNGLISQDGNGLTGQMSTDDVGTAGVSLAAGIGNSSLISQDGNGLVSSGSGTLVAAHVISNDGGSVITTQGGNVLSGSGASGVISNDGGSALPSGDVRPAGSPTTRGWDYRRTNANGRTATGPVQVGTPDQTAVFHATPAGTLIQVGSTTGLFQK